MIETINVLDLGRGDTVVIVAGHGKHRGASSDMGCIDVSAPSVKSEHCYNLFTIGRHAKPLPKGIYDVFLGYGGDRFNEDRFAVPTGMTVTVMR